MKRGTPWSFYELKVAKDAYSEKNSVKYWIFKFFVYLCSVLLH